MKNEEKMFVEASRKALELSTALEDLKNEISEYMNKNRSLEHLNKALDLLIQRFEGISVHLKNLAKSFEEGTGKVEKSVITFEQLSKLMDRRFDDLVKSLAELNISLEEMGKSTKTSLKSLGDKLEELQNELEKSGFHLKRLNKKTSWTLALLLPSLILIAGVVILLLYPL